MGKRRRKQIEDDEASSQEEELSDTEDGSNDEAEAEDDNDGNESEEEEEEILEPKVLPQRVTRGGRMSQLLDEQESADEEFWNQDFFAEEDRDQEFSASESEQEDIPDSDFSESEDDDDDLSDDAIEAQTRKEERKGKKTLKPPGPGATSKKPPPIKAGPKGGAKGLAKQPVSPNTRAAIKAAKEADAAEFGAPTLRRSTLQRTEEAKKERQEAERLVRPKKRRQEVAVRHLSQEELLAEAAQTEIFNLRSLEALQAAEEEVKKRAAVKRVGYSGPCIRFHSKQINGESLVSCEVANMLLPPEMRKQKAPAPRAIPQCAVTGQAAKYKDPLTGYPFADSAAFRVLRQHHGHLTSQQRPGQVKAQNRDGSNWQYGSHLEDQ